MRIRILLVGTLVQAVFCFSPNGTVAQQSDAGSRSGNASDLNRSREIYKRDCLVCHGANGEGKTEILRDRQLNLPDWTDPKSLGGRTDQQLFSVIRLGKGKMPAESAGRADDAEVRDLIRYIRTMMRDEAVVGAPARSASSPNK